MIQQETKKVIWYRVKFLALIVVFLSPYIGGWLAFYVFEIRPESGNYGELVQPVKKLDWPILQTIDGKRLESGFDDKWSFLLFTRGSCDEACRTNLFYMRQIRILQGRNTSRLQNVLVSAEPVSADLLEFLREYPDLVVIDKFADDDLYRQFQLPGQGPVGSTAKMYLVDPANNLMMHYPADSDQNRVLEDIRNLMKLSQIG